MYAGQKNEEGEEKMREKIIIVLKGGSTLEVNLENQLVSFDKNVLKIHTIKETSEPFSKSAYDYLALPVDMVEAFEL